MAHRARIASALLALVLLGGCDGAGTAEGPAQPVPAAGVPEFSGPWAAEFSRTYAGATSDFVREALADERISDAEHARAVEAFTTCLAEIGIEFRGFDTQNGGYSTSTAPHGQDTHELVSGCEASSGYGDIGMLHDVVTTNPENLDMPTLIAQCLVREGVVPAGYSGSDYDTDAAQWYADPEGLPDELAESLLACTHDPSRGG